MPMFFPSLTKTSPKKSRIYSLLLPIQHLQAMSCGSQCFGASTHGGGVAGSSLRIKFTDLQNVWEISERPYMGIVLSFLDQ